MAREVKFGIVVEAVDKAATALIAGVGKAAGTSSKAVSMMAESGERSMRMLKGAVVGLNQGLELGMKAWRGLNDIFGSAIRSALDYRTANDGVTRELKKFENGVGTLHARFGDALLPVLQGVARAMTPILDTATAWVTKNRELIGTKVLEWAMKVASVLVTGIAKGMTVVIEAWNGWKMLIGVVDAAISKFFGMVIDGSAHVLETMGHVAKALHMDGVSESIGGVATNMRDLAKTFHESASEAMDGVRQNAQQMDSWTAKIAGVERAMQNGIGHVGVQAQKALAQSTIGTTHTLEAQAQASEKLRAAMALYYQFAETKEQGLTDITMNNVARRAEISDKALQQMESHAQTMVGAATSIGDAWAQAFQQIAAGSQDATVLMIKAVIQSARIAIMTAAAVAAAQEIQAHAWMGVAGIAAGMVAAGVIFGVIEGFLSRIPTAPAKAARGGLVVGGVPGVDSVPILAQQGERVLTVDQNRQWERGHGMGMGRGGTTVNVSMQTQLPPNSVQRKQLLRDLQKDLISMIKNKQLVVPVG